MARRNFHFHPLSPCIVSLVEENDSQDADLTAGDGNLRGGKKKKTSEKGGTVDNPNTWLEWIFKPLEIFNDIFGRPEDVHLRPKGMCTRYHIKGYCFSSCKYPHCEPTQEQASKFTIFVNAMRRRVAGATTTWKARHDHVYLLPPKLIPPDQNPIQCLIKFVQIQDQLSQLWRAFLQLPDLMFTGNQSCPRRMLISH